MCGTVRVMSRVAEVHSMTVVRLLLLLLLVLLLSRALVDGRLHLLQDTIDCLEITLGTDARHRWQEIVLCERAGSVTHTSADTKARRVSSEELVGGQRSSAQRSVNGHQGTADLAIRRGVDLAPLHISEEVVKFVESALTGVE
jgi:hypothetical protein